MILYICFFCILKNIFYGKEENNFSFLVLLIHYFLFIESYENTCKKAFFKLKTEIASSLKKC